MTPASSLCSTLVLDSNFLRNFSTSGESPAIQLGENYLRKISDNTGITWPHSVTCEQKERKTISHPLNHWMFWPFHGLQQRQIGLMLGWSFEVTNSQL
jgi:hypothetical protein